MHDHLAVIAHPHTHTQTAKTVLGKEMRPLVSASLASPLFLRFSISFSPPTHCRRQCMLLQLEHTGNRKREVSVSSQTGRRERLEQERDSPPLMNGPAKGVDVVQFGTKVPEPRSLWSLCVCMCSTRLFCHHPHTHRPPSCAYLALSESEKRRSVLSME